MRELLRKAKYLRLTLVLLAIVLLAFYFYRLTFYYGHSEFKAVRIELPGKTFYTAAGVLEFRTDGKGSMFIAGQPETNFAFDIASSSRAVYRRERLWKSVAEVTRRSPQAIYLTVGDSTQDCTLGSARTLSNRDAFVASLGLSDLYQLSPTQEDVTMTFAAELLQTVDKSDRERMVQALQNVHTLAVLEFWLNDPLCPMDQPPPEKMLTPPPWTEIQRVTSPDGTLDAVIATRSGLSFGRPDDREAPQTNLFILAKGAAVKDGAPYRFGDAANYYKRERKIAPFQVVGSKQMTVRWKDDSTLHLSHEHMGAVFSQSSSFEAPSPVHRTLEIVYSHLPKSADDSSFTW